MSTSPRASRSLLSLESSSPSLILKFIETAMQLKSGALKPVPSKGSPPVAVLAFFEPSTRTRVSFEIAAHRLGVKPVSFTADASTSLVKGESVHETLETLLAMRPDLLVIRYGTNARVDAILARGDVPTINAGAGVQEHPTQALLDAMTVLERRGSLAGQKIVYVGDVEHSRVANSGRAVFAKMGAEVAVCAPPELMPQSSAWAQARRFDDLNAALKWGSVVIGLRLQKERHALGAKISEAAYVESFRLDSARLKNWSPDGLLMHPGPFLPEVDLSEDILNDPRCAIHQQVTNGVFVRMAVIGDLLGLSYS